MVPRKKYSELEDLEVSFNEQRKVILLLPASVFPSIKRR